MAFYWGLWIVFLVLSVAWKKEYYRHSYMALLLIIFLLSVISGGREYVGADWESYQTYYKTGYAFDKASGHMEIIFETLRNICHGLDLSYGMFCCIISIISLSVLWKAMKIMKVENCFLAFLVYLSLFFCNYQFNIVRHGLLASFIMLGMAYLSKEQYYRSLFCVVVSSGFHLMGLLFIPVLFFINKTLSKKWFYIIIGVSITVFMADISGRIVAAFPFLSLIDRVEGYVDIDRNEVYRISIGTICFLTIASFAIIIRRYEYENIPIFRISANMLLAGFMVFCFFNAFSAIVQRVGNLFNLGIIFLLPYMWCFVGRNKREIVRILIVAYLALYYPKSWNVMNENGDYTMLPFKTNITNLL